jgi:hypothetical protein
MSDQSTGHVIAEDERHAGRVIGFGWVVMAAVVIFALFGGVLFVVPELRSAPTTWGGFAMTFVFMLLIAWRSRAR